MIALRCLPVIPFDGKSVAARRLYPVAQFMLDRHLKTMYTQVIGTLGKRPIKPAAGQRRRCEFAEPHWLRL
jgi:hypothetical protein